MADYYTSASFMFARDITPLELLWFNKEMDACPDEMEEKELEKWAQERGVDDPECWPGFAADYAQEEGCIWIRHDESINVEHAAGFVQYFLKTHRPKETVCIEWSNTCNKARLDGFGGGVAIVTAKRIHWMPTGYYIQHYAEMQKALRKLVKHVDKKHPAQKAVMVLDHLLTK